MLNACYPVASYGCYSWWVSLSECISRFIWFRGVYMHPKTAAALAALSKSLQETAHLERRLLRLAQHRPPLYWELNPSVLCTVKQLRFALQEAQEELARLAQSQL